MMKFRKVLLVFLVFSLALAVLYTPAWTQDGDVDYSVRIYDLLCLRPAACLGGIVGTVAFVMALPFTVASGGVDDSYNMFVRKPFWYAFVRKFPDDSVSEH